MGKINEFWADTSYTMIGNSAVCSWDEATYPIDLAQKYLRDRIYLLKKKHLLYDDVRVTMTQDGSKLLIENIDDEKALQNIFSLKEGLRIQKAIKSKTNLLSPAQVTVRNQKVLEYKQQAEAKRSDVAERAHAKQAANKPENISEQIVSRPMPKRKKPTAENPNLQSDEVNPQQNTSELNSFGLFIESNNSPPRTRPSLSSILFEPEENNLFIEYLKTFNDQAQNEPDNNAADASKRRKV